MSDTLIVLPRPGTQKNHGEKDAIEAPSEAAFVGVFGARLPKAQFISTAYGRAAYYTIAPSSPIPTHVKNPISRVLFIHGVQTPAIGLQPLAQALSSRFPYVSCVLVDLWGHGLTDTPIIPHEPASFHHLIRELMMKLQWKDAHLVGYSFGGSTVASYAALKPELVASITLVAPAGLLRASQLTEVEKEYMRGGEGLEDRAKAWVLEFLEGGQLVVPSDWKERVERGEVVAEAVRDWQMKNHKGHPASVIGIFRDGGVFDKHTEFAAASRTGIRSFCVLGELDDLCSVKDLHDVGMNNVVVIPQVGHGVVRERAPEVAEFIDGFWRGIEQE